MKAKSSQVSSLREWQQQNLAVPAVSPESPLGRTLALAQIAFAHSPLQTKQRETELVSALLLLQGLQVDADTLAACVLYDVQAVANDTVDVTLFPQHVRELVDGQHAAEKVWSLYAAHSGSANAEGLRRLLLAIIRDLRVVFILLARQLARMRVAGSLPLDQQRALAQLTADIHAPLANRLGIWQFKWELEDLAFRYGKPEIYKRIATLLDERREDRESYIRNAITSLRSALVVAGITHVDLAGRPKHIYSIWRKMSRKEVDFSGLYDIRAIRVLVKDVASCYAALGIVHSLWVHVPGEFDDYITRPKGNNYQSLHTAVIGPEGKTLEVQIRSFDMHEHAELGVAAHWRYKEGGGGDQSFERKIAWMRQLIETKDEQQDDAAILAGFKTDILEDRVYLLTPQGQVMDLPHGATVLDFAYHVHTDVGHRCRGAKVNGRIVPLTFQPSSGDRVEILTGKVSEPRRDWLSQHHGFLSTHRAQEKVRAWFRKIDHEANVMAGRTLLERELKRLALNNVELETLPQKFHLKNLDELLIGLAIGDISASHVARVLHEAVIPLQPAIPSISPPRSAKPTKDALVIEGVGNLLTTLARCCQPLPGDVVLGFITQGRGVSIHRGDCKSLARLRLRDPSRIIDVEWGSGRGQAYEVNLLVRGYDRKGLHKDVTSVISGMNIHLLAVDARIEPNSATVSMSFAVRVNDFEQLSTLLNRLVGVPNVIEARRLA